MPEVMTKEYCRQCPWFHEGIGFLPEDHPYWENHQSECMCKSCPRKNKCEAEGPEEDAGSCLIVKYS